MTSDWKCYQHMMLPTCAPHEDPDLSPIEDGSVFDGNRGAVLARWTTDFDCEYETDFWYVIKDTPFDISGLKAKRRYEITKGMKNFDVRVIRAAEYAAEMADVMEDAYASWPVQYRPPVEKETWEKGFLQWDAALQETPSNDRETAKIYGAFDKTGKLCGFAKLGIYKDYIGFHVLRVSPSCEKAGINAAITYAIMQDFSELRSSGKSYICDGTRNIYHDTNFQEYLRKYFGWRRAYCRLHIKYRWPMGIFIRLLYPFRSIFQKAKGPGYKIWALLYMEKIRRSCEQRQSALR